MKRNCLLFLLGISLIFANWSYATVIEFTFYGKFTEASNWYTGGMQTFPIITPNTPFEGYFRLDTENWGWQPLPGGGMAGSPQSTIAMTTIWGPPENRSSAYLYYPIYDITMTSNSFSAAGYSTSNFLGLSYNSNNQFNAEKQLLLALLNLSQWETVRFTYMYEWLSGGYYRGEVESIAPIPEPSTILLLGSGLVALIGFRRKFRSKP